MYAPDVVSCGNLYLWTPHKDAALINQVRVPALAALQQSFWLLYLDMFARLHNLFFRIH
ncbi:hypothetical protein PCCS19_26670 [Paenibacillus sp. CCS19]|nr:hypothetical protein PCCS19_26670 [Paenibacillus cellulosilyticus]